MMLEKPFMSARASKRPAFIPYLMAGDPDLATTKLLLEALPDAGADIIELGIPYGEAAPSEIDLLIDFTGPRQRHKWFLARRLRSHARVTIGRNAGIFRQYIYDRVYDEFANKAEVPRDVLARERFVQKKLLEMAGIPISTQGELGPDLGRKIAVDLPPLKRG